MRTISTNKAETLCAYCHKNLVPIGKWNRKCDECKEKAKEKKADVKKTGRGLTTRIPAAVIKTDDGTEVFVDKFGKEVDNPGYDLKNDPRGWGFTKKKKDVTII